MRAIGVRKGGHAFSKTYGSPVARIMHVLIAVSLRLLYTYWPKNGVKSIEILVQRSLERTTRKSRDLYLSCQDPDED